MDKQREKWRKRNRRHHRVRRKVEGNMERPRLVIYRSLKHTYAQIVDDIAGRTLLGASTLTPAVRESLPAGRGGDRAAATILGAYVAKKAREQGITKVAFDRGGYKFHGRVKAFAEAARGRPEAGDGQEKPSEETGVGLEF